MDLIKHPTGVDAANPPTPIQTGTPGWAARGQTVITADVINGIIAELKNVIEGAGLDLNVNNNTLLKTAIETMVGDNGISYDPANQGTVTVDALKLVASIIQSTNITSTAITANTFTANSTSTFKGIVNIQPLGNGAIELGRIDHVGSTPYIDFHSGATPVDTDSRIIATGGNGVNFGGTLTIQAAQLNVPAGTIQGADKIDSFPDRTKIVFYQAAAPAGWVAVNPGNDYVLVTTSSTLNDGGTLVTPAGGHNIVTGCTVVASHTHTTDPQPVTGTTSSNGAHDHNVSIPLSIRDVDRGGGSSWFSMDDPVAIPSDGVHTHTVSINIPLTTSSVNTNLGVWKPKYANVLICSKTLI